MIINLKRLSINCFFFHYYYCLFMEIFSWQCIMGSLVQNNLYWQNKRKQRPLQSASRDYIMHGKGNVPVSQLIMKLKQKHSCALTYIVGYCMLCNSPRMRDSFHFYIIISMVLIMYVHAYFGVHLS